MIQTIIKGADFDIDPFPFNTKVPFNKKVAIFCVEQAEFIQYHSIKGSPTLPILWFNDGEFISLSSIDNTKNLFIKSDISPLEAFAKAMKIINSFVRPVLVKNEGLGWHLEEENDTIDWLKLTPFVKNRN